MNKTIFKWQKSDTIEAGLDASDVRELDAIEQRHLGIAIGNAMRAMEKYCKISSKHDLGDFLDALPELSHAVGIDYTAPPPHKKEGDMAIFFTKPWYRDTIFQFNNAGSAGENTLDRQIGFITKTLKLSPPESKMMAMAARVHLFADWEYLSDTIGYALHHRIEHDVSAIVTGQSRVAIRDASCDESMLKQCNIMHFGTPHNMMLRSSIRGFFSKKLRSEAEMINNILTPAALPHLEMDDFGNLQKPLSDAISLLQKLPYDDGCNILLYGPPGTGKTEAAKCIARELNLAAVFVGCADQYGNEPTPTERIGNLRLLRNFVGENANALLIIDEAEDLFREAQDQIRSKQWLNRLIENGKGPHIWIVNNPSKLGEVIVRRMDMVVAFDWPDRTERKKIIHKIYNDMAQPSNSMTHDESADDYALELSPIKASPALIKAALSSNMQMDGDIDNAKILLRQLMIACGRDPIETRPPNADQFEPSLCNANEDLTAITAQLIDSEKLRSTKILQNGDGWNILLSGPPGTGKSAYAAYLADQMGLDLLALQGADLLTPYVGEAEQNIKKAFESAGHKPVILLIDEVDGLLGDRRDMRQSWQVSQVNAMLTAMERDRARFIATTNLDERLDQASARRFSMHIKFGALTPRQASTLFERYFDNAAPDTLDNMHMLTPGDFAQAKKRMRFCRDASPDIIVKWLTQACDARSTKRPIGFAAAA